MLGEGAMVVVVAVVVGWGVRERPALHSSVLLHWNKHSWPRPKELPLLPGAGCQGGRGAGALFL